MLFGNDMAFFAWQRSMMRDSLFGCDLTVASAAFLRLMRQQGIMCIMTGYARFAGIVQHSNDLRKPGGPRWIITVAEGTIPPLSRGIRNKFIGGFYMLRGRAMAHLAGDISMVGFGFLAINIIMAIIADLIAGIFNFLIGNFIDGVGPIVAVSSK